MKEFSFSEFTKEKVRKGEMRPATPEELAPRVCANYWHRLPESIRCGTCPTCGQRLKGWYYEAQQEKQP